MVKINTRQIVKRIKDKEKQDERKNYTFRFKIKDMESFAKNAEKQNVSMTSVLEEFINEFNKEFK